ncbi:MAG: hypothetical protein HW403_197 [Dehalococcoidia bacterium]|nr:hypothetical protein [Dehalococcoidia bacterium]
MIEKREEIGVPDTLSPTAAEVPVTKPADGIFTYLKTSRWARGFVPLVVVALAFLALQMVQDKGQSSSAAATSGVAPVSSGIKARVGEPAPEFTLQNLAGEAVALKDFRGQTVLVNFWATWCGPCRVEMPEMEAIYKEKAGDGFTILAVNFKEDPERASSFARNLGLTFPVLLDSKGQVADAYGVIGLPTSLFIDGDGIVKAMQVGEMNKSVIARKLRQITEGE